MKLGKWRYSYFKFILWTDTIYNLPWTVRLHTSLDHRVGPLYLDMRNIWKMSRFVFLLASTWQELTISLPISRYTFSPDGSSNVHISLKFKGHWKIKYFEVNNSMHISRQQLPDTQLLFFLDIDGLCVRQHVTLLCTEVWFWPRNNYYNVTYFRPVHKKDECSLVRVLHGWF